MAKKGLSEEALEFFRRAGARGGKIGGKMALTNMTPEERHARAKKAALASAAKRAKVTKKRGRATSKKATKRAK